MDIQPQCSKYQRLLKKGRIYVRLSACMSPSPGEESWTWWTQGKHQQLRIVKTIFRQQWPPDLSPVRPSTWALSWKFWSPPRWVPQVDWWLSTSMQQPDWFWLVSSYWSKLWSTCFQFLQGNPYIFLILILINKNKRSFFRSWKNCAFVILDPPFIECQFQVKN